MAWEEFERNGIKGITGDRPLDEIAIALQQIVIAYEETFARKPTITEIVRALETVIGANPTRYVSDPDGLRFAEITIQRDYQREKDYIDISQYAAVHTDAIYPSYYAILYLQSEVIKITKLEVNNSFLICEYTILTENITDKIAQALILKKLLGDYCDHFYKNQVEQIHFINIKSHTEQIIPYS